MSIGCLHPCPGRSRLLINPTVSRIVLRIVERRSVLIGRVADDEGHAPLCLCGRRGKQHRKKKHETDCAKRRMTIAPASMEAL